jgi:hypothetical protein
VGVVVEVVAFASFAVTSACVAVGACPVVFCVYWSDATAGAVAYVLGWVSGGGPWLIVGEDLRVRVGDRGAGGLGRGSG